MFSSFWGEMEACQLSDDFLNLDYLGRNGRLH